MKILRNYILLLTFFLLSLNGNSQAPYGKVPDYTGEIMTYKLKYGILNIGYATISCLADQSGDSIHIKAEAQSSGFIKMIKDIDYRFECYMDPESGLPVSAIRSLKDGRNNLYNELLFDQASRKDSTIIYSQASGKHIVGKNMYDLLTGFFHFRKNYIDVCNDPGDEVIIKTFFSDELWDLKIRYGKRATIETKYGKLDCIMYKPITVIGRFFRHDDDMLVWFTDDESAVPVEIRLNLILGSIRGHLIDYQPPENSNTSMVKQE